MQVVDYRHKVILPTARIQFNKKTMVVEDVKLMPTIDTDVTVLEVLRHCVTSLESVASLKTNGVRVKIDLADSCEGAEEELQETRYASQRIWKLTIGVDRESVETC